MKRRAFIKSLAIFTGLFTLSSKLELTRAFPFVRRKPVTPQMVSTATAQGLRTLRLPVSYAQKGDVLIAIVTAHNPNGSPVTIEAQTGWTMISRQEIQRYTQESWYMTADRDLNETECMFAVHNAERTTGQLSVIRGAKVQAS